MGLYTTKKKWEILFWFLLAMYLVTPWLSDVFPEHGTSIFIFFCIVGISLLGLAVAHITKKVTIWKES